MIINSIAVIACFKNESLMVKRTKNQIFKQEQILEIICFQVDGNNCFYNEYEKLRKIKPLSQICHDISRVIFNRVINESTCTCCTIIDKCLMFLFKIVICGLIFFIFFCLNCIKETKIIKWKSNLQMRININKSD